MRRFLARCLAFLQRGRAEREMERELASHLALIAEDFERRGLPPAEARLAALRAYGGVEQARELHRDARSWVGLEQLLQDLRHSARSLSRTPGFTLLAIATLALGVGVNTTLFTAYDTLALRPLAVANPDRVVRFERWLESRNLGDVQYAFSEPEYRYFREHGSLFAAVVANSFNQSVLARIGRQPEKIAGQLVSANYFESLGIRAQLGRTFLPDETDPVLVISHPFWQKRFGGEPSVLGRTAEINGVTCTIVGVAAPEFTGTAVSDPFVQFWAPLALQARLIPPRLWQDDPKARQLQILARLQPGVPLKRAEAEASLLVRQFGGTYREQDPTTAITLQHTSLLGNTEDIRFKAVVAGVMMLVGLVLLVACANIANMLLARAAGRQREIAIRLAMGASRGRMIRHLLTEALLLSICGGSAGLILAAWSNRLLSLFFARLLSGTPLATNGLVVDLSLDVRVFAYAFVISLAAGLFFGLAPALQFSRPDLTTALKDEGSAYGRRLTRSRLRGFLVGAQVTVSMTLLITAGLLFRGLVRSQDADPGFETRRLFLLAADFSGRPLDLRARLISRLQSLPQVQNVAQGESPMLGTWTPPIVVKESSAKEPLFARTLASRGTETYLDTVGIPLLRGRMFTEQEVRTHQPVAVISESAARRFWLREDPLGRRFSLDMDFRGHMADFEVIGIVKDVRFANLTRIDPAHVYLTPKAGEYPNLLVRAQGDPRRALDAIRDAVAAVDPDLLPGLFLTSVQDGPIAMQKTAASVFAIFASILAALAMVLAGVGIYGVMSYVVSQRVQEIGVRMALGATAGEVMRGVILRGLRPVLAGIVLGIAGAAALSTLLHATLVFPGSTDVLYGIPFYDPPTFLGLAAFLTAVAAIASAVPARRAVRGDPMAALRVG